MCAAGVYTLAAHLPNDAAKCASQPHLSLFSRSQLSHPRSFSKRSSRICLGIASFYLCWILVCSHFNGVFPYPFLNKMPWPQVRSGSELAVASETRYAILMVECHRHSEGLEWR